VDISNLGPKQGAEVVYNWRWYHSIPSLALWLVLAAALILIKTNRTPRILFIFVPLLIVNTGCGDHISVVVCTEAWQVQSLDCIFPGFSSD